ncbi:MAG: hypothetical protein KJ938_05715 [Actinobacteria bacterium]|jgi:hypothetical protein|nr:hypothetical protein [Actinomycetota bacterium]
MTTGADAAAEEDRGLALLSALAACWPEASVPPSRNAAHPEEFAAEYAWVPDAAHPRLLVPVSPPRAAACSLRRFSAASSPAEVVRRLGAATAVRVTGARVLTQRVGIRMGAPDSLAHHLEELLDCRVTFAVAVGSARVNRKPVLQVFDERGRCRAFVKLGDSPQARADVAAEALALARLEAWRLRYVEVPRVLALSRWRDMVVLALTPLPTSPRPVHDDDPLLGRAMGEVEALHPTHPLALTASPWAMGLRRAAHSWPDQELARRYLGCLEQVLEDGGDRPVVHGAWHGDWTPWNMARGRRRIRLWDWERFETGVPAGLDRVHFRVASATRARGLRTEVVLAALRDLAPQGEDLPLHADPRDLYLLAISARYLGLLDAARGADVAGAAHVALGTLEARLAGRRSRQSE